MTGHDLSLAVSIHIWVFIWLFTGSCFSLIFIDDFICYLATVELTGSFKLGSTNTVPVKDALGPFFLVDQSKEVR